MTRLTKWLLAIAAVSLIVNLFAVGYILGELRRGEHRAARDIGREMGDPVMSSLRVLAEQMTPEAREEFRQNLRQLGRNNKADLRRMRELNHDILDHLRQDEIDADWLRQSYAELRDLANKTRAPFQGMFANTIAGMNAEQRRAFLEDMKKIIEHGRHRHHYHKNKHGKECPEDGDRAREGRRGSGH